MERRRRTTPKSRARNMKESRPGNRRHRNQRPYAENRWARRNYSANRKTSRNGRSQRSELRPRETNPRKDNSTRRRPDLRTDQLFEIVKQIENIGGAFQKFTDTVAYLRERPGEF